MSYFLSPMYFGIQDHTVAGAPSFGVRVYHPTDDDVIVGAPLPAGPHPLVVFAHGDRSGESLCPPERTQDYRRWTHVVGALARSGFVVAVPELTDVIFSPDDSAQRIVATIAWMRTQWTGRRTLHTPLVFDPGVVRRAHASETASPPQAYPGPDDAESEVSAGRGPVHTPPVVLGNPTALALVGHSWGARACARVAAGGGVKALAAIAGSWDDDASIVALHASRVPTLLMCGTEDQQNFSALNGLWTGLATPKYQAAFQGVQHWDWFGLRGAIRQCDDTPPAWPDTGHIAGELIVGFLTRHVARIAFDPPHLVRIPLLRPWMAPWFDHGSAIQVRWDAPGEQFHPLPAAGDGILGPWTTPAPW